MRNLNGLNFYQIGIHGKLQETYPARKDLGGGCSLTLSHELDTFYWLFGALKKVYNFKSSKYLNIKVDTISDFILKFKNNVIGYIHIDFLLRPHERKLQIIGTKKNLTFDYYKNEIITTNRKGKVSKTKVKFEK